jgi:hypothetical protein
MMFLDWWYRFVRPQRRSTRRSSLRGTRAKQQCHRLSFETLEDRRLLAVAPASIITFPVDSGVYNSSTWTGVIQGTASATSPATVSQVDVSIEQNATGEFWNGTAFASGPTSVTASGTDTWSLTFPASNLTDGTYTVTSLATDSDGTTETTGPTATFVYDNTAPTAGTVVDGSGATETSFQSSTTILSANWSGFTDGSGSGVVSYKWAIGTTAGGTDIQDYTSTGISGTSATATGLTLTDGTKYFISVEAIDAASNVSSPATSSGVTIDSSVPSATVSLATGQNATTNTSPINFTVVFSEAVTGFSSSGVVVTGTAGGTKTVNVTGSGTTYNVSISGLTDGTVIMNVADGAAQNQGGVANTASSTATVSFDSTAPDAPSTPILALASHSGSYNSDTTSITTPVVTGTAEANSTITIFDGTTSLGTTTADSSGNWSFTTPTLSVGTHTLTAQATDAAGNTSVSSGALTLNIIAGESQTQHFVLTLYTRILNRTAEDGGYQFWTNLLESGVTQTQMVAEMLGCSETQADFINGQYQSVLGRTADPAGSQFMVQSLQGGASFDSIRASLLGSDEYFQNAGGTNTGFVTALFNSVLGRGADAAGLAFYTQQLSGGTTRDVIVSEMMNSSEGDQQLIQNLYQQYLQRSADAGGLAYYVAQMQQGQHEQDIIAFLLGLSSASSS